jgi:hypothetical protein
MLEERQYCLVRGEIYKEFKQIHCLLMTMKSSPFLGCNFTNCSRGLLQALPTTCLAHIVQKIEAVFSETSQKYSIK